MKTRCLFFLLAAAILLMTIPAGAAPAAGEIERFWTLPDNRVAVRTSLGVRRAWSVDPAQVKLVIGASCTEAASEATAYRILSFEDDAYAYDRFVTPVSAAASNAVEAAGGAEAPVTFRRTVVTLKLPTPMKPGKTYHVVAQGVGQAIVTAGHTAASFVCQDAGADTRETTPVDLAVIGLRRVESVGNGLLLLEFGPGFQAATGMALEGFRVSRNGAPAPILNIGRLSRIDTYLPVGWPFKVLSMHEVFVQLGAPLANGDLIAVEVASNVTVGARTASLRFQDRQTLSNSLKVNQVGYLTDSPVKVAYLGRWMGSFPELLDTTKGKDNGGDAFWQTLNKKEAPTTNAAPRQTPALDFPEPPAFGLCAADTGEPVYTGQSRLIHRSGTANEGVSGMDHSGENVYLMDFSTFKQPGRYFLSVPGVGRSLAFAIGADVYEQAFKAQAYGVFAQRCGIELKPPYSDWRRIACHRHGVIPTTLARASGESRAHSTLPECVDYSRLKDVKAPPALAALDRDLALLAHWPLDRDLKDVSGNNRHLVPGSGKASFTPTPRIMPGGNQAWGPSVDEKKPGAATAGPVTLDTAKGLTICSWVRLGGGLKFEGTLWGHSPTNWADARIRVSATWGALSAEAGNQKSLLTFGRLSDGAWHHLAQVISPTASGKGTVTIYIDGVARTMGPATPAVSKGNFVLGGLTGEESAGKCYDEVRVYGRALKAEEIRQLSVPWGERILAIPAYGGHHDAGDYNPRSHIDVAQVLMNAYELAPKKFYDGQLNIPEAGNGIPDLLDEAAWSMQLWIGLQDADGGVFGGTESNGDPNFVQTVELDLLGDYAFAKDAAASYTYAGVMAQAARIWRGLGKREAADAFLTRARSAYAWAEAQPKPDANKPDSFAGQYLSPKAYASAQLLHTTGESRFNEDFLSVCVWARKPDADLQVHRLYDQQDAAWAYARCEPAAVDANVQQSVKRAIIRQADVFIQYSSTMAYGFIRHPWAPISWGSGAYENWLDPLFWAQALTGDDKYRYWIIRTCDNTLGANPLNRSYITGLGSRTVRAALHNSRYGYTGEVAPGMQVQGPTQKGEGYGVPEAAYPRLREDFASLYTFVDAHFAIVYDEGTINNQVKSMAAFGLLQPDHIQPKATP